MDIREIDGLWCDDITFCQETCKHMDCPRNKHHIRDRSVPHSFSVDVPTDCPKKQECGLSEMTDRFDIPETETIKIKRQIPMTATRCLACGKWERPEINNELYEALIIRESYEICDSCRKAIEWAKEHMNDSD